jgi:hypothetical protein
MNPEKLHKKYFGVYKSGFVGIPFANIRSFHFSDLCVHVSRRVYQNENQQTVGHFSCHHVCRRHFYPKKKGHLNILFASSTSVQRVVKKKKGLDQSKCYFGWRNIHSG